MSSTPITLSNRYLVARFSPEDGRLVHLSPDGHGDGLIAGLFHRYRDRSADCWHTDESGADGQRIETVSCAATETSVTSIHRSEHLALTLRYELPQESPLLHIRVEVRGNGRAGELVRLATPGVVFSPGFLDVFEDERELYADGAELGGGRELPCWRVFFREGHETGLMLAARGKDEMARFHVRADGFELQPHGFLNYSTAPLEFHPPLDPASRSRYQARFEIGPWERARHEEILQAGGLNEPVCVPHPPARGRPKATLKGEVFYAVDFAGDRVAGGEHDPARWRVIDAPWAQKGRALFASTGVNPPALTLDPKLNGLYRVSVGIGNGEGVLMQLSGDPEPSFRLPPWNRQRHWRHPAFSLYLSGSHRPAEVFYGVARMDGRSVRLECFPNGHGATVLDYVRFEPLSPAQSRAWPAKRDRKPSISLSGFNDIPDLAILTDAADPDPRAYRANVWEHANCGFTKIFWRIDGQCSDYPSKVNTMRYLSAKVHNLFHPQSKAYSRALDKVDMLAMAVEAAREYGVELYGWMRFNNYTGNVQSDFYKSHPEFWEFFERENGAKRPAGKLCLAFPEVRRHKIDILVEAAGYGLQGLNLGFLRHPPILLYHPVLVESFRAKFGTLPPRDPDAKDPHFVNSLPFTDEAHAQWYQHRADVMTLFGQELRAALRQKGLAHVKISIWVRPNHCLFDGIDLPAWLDQGLCDEVVVNGVYGPEIFTDAPDDAVCGVRPEWKQRVQARVPLIRCLNYHDIRRWRKHLPGVLAEGYDGLCTYESDWAVLDGDFIELYQRLRGLDPARTRGL